MSKIYSMLFNSLQFLIFFPIVTTLYFVIGPKYRWVLLLLSSCLFYMAYIPKYIIILFVTILIDYMCGILIEEASGDKKRLWLYISIASNLSILCFFKYYNFFLDNLIHVFSIGGYQLNVPYLNILLPIGLSFHTFQAMAYTIEIYRGNQLAERHLGIYSLYVMFFPQLVAGPIERPQNLLPQFHREHRFSYDNLRDGLCLMGWGFFKKMVIADRLAYFVNSVYGNLHAYTGISLVVAIVFFAFQIYCDFSGYSDIALGSAQVLGIKLMKNFNSPFTSTSVTEFWRRWHISLSTWFNDYLFMPLSLKFRNWGTWGLVFALLITFFLSGLWHGAGWPFIIFGCLHGLALVYELLTKKIRKSWSKKYPTVVYNGISRILVFVFATVSWIFFRSQSLGNAFYIIKNLVKGISSMTLIPDKETLSSILYLNQGAASFYFSIILIVFLLITEYLSRTNGNIIELLRSKNIVLRYSVYYFMVLLIVSFGILSTNSFIYFQF